MTQGKVNASVYASVDIPDDVTCGGIMLYKRHRNFPTTWTKIGLFDPGDEEEIKGLFKDVPYEVAAALVDADGNVAPEKDWIIERWTPQGSTTDALPAVTNLGAAQDGEYVEAKWDDVSENCPGFSRYEVRVGSSWADGRVVGIAFKSATLRWKWEADKAITVRVKTGDVYGKRSAETTVAITVKPLGNYVDGNEQDEDTGGFTATKTDVEVDTGKLQYKRWGTPANTITGLANTWTHLPAGPARGTYEAAEVDLGSARNVRLELDMDVDSDGDWADRMAEDWIVPPISSGHDVETAAAVDLSDPAAAMEPGLTIAGGDDTAPDVRVFIKHDTSTPISTDYQPYIPGYYYCRYYRIKVLIYSWDRWRRFRISKLRIQERKKNLKDEGTFSVSGAGPHDVNLVQPFIDAPYILAVHSGTGNYVEVTNITTVDFDATAYDCDDVEVTTGSIYWMAVGT